VQGGLARGAPRGAWLLPCFAGKTGGGKGEFMTEDEHGAAEEPPSADRRKDGDRRKADAPYDGPERRKGDRRSGSDRRAKPRS